MEKVSPVMVQQFATTVKRLVQPKVKNYYPGLDAEIEGGDSFWGDSMYIKLVCQTTGHLVFRMDVKAGYESSIGRQLTDHLGGDQEIYSVAWSNRRVARDWQGGDWCGMRLYLTALNALKTAHPQVAAVTSDTGLDLSAGSLGVWLTLHDEIRVANWCHNAHDYTFGKELTLSQALMALKNHPEDEELSFTVRNLFFYKMLS
tara:strand:- start:153 stop:758 length:606 start_codon:yes stop_codon:yes gene_type:complete